MIELLPDHAVNGRPKPIALWFSIALHAAITFGVWRHEPFRYNAVVHAAAPGSITWFQGRLTMPRPAESNTAPVPEKTALMHSAIDHADNFSRTGFGPTHAIAPAQGDSTGGPVGYSAPLAWFGGLLDEESAQSGLKAALTYSPAGHGIVSGLLSGVNEADERGFALPPPPPSNDAASTADAPTEPEPAIRIGGRVTPAVIVKKTFPKYPPAALQAGIQGVVVFEATIGEDGKLRDIKVTSGHPLLIPAAADCIKNWRYQPTLLNGEIISSPATIEVRFVIQRSQSR